MHSQAAKYVFALAVLALGTAHAQTVPQPAPPATAAAPASATAQPNSVSTAPDCSNIKPSAASHQVKYVNPESMFETQSYSMATVIPATAKLVYISGQIPVNIQYSITGTDLISQVKAAMDNLCRVMQAGGISKQDIIKLGITYVNKDASDPFQIAEQMSAFFGRDQMPATTMVGVDFLITDKIRFQVEATAVID